MRVLYDHQTFFLQKYGGISRYFYELIKRVLISKNCEVDLFKGFNCNQYKFDLEINDCNCYASYNKPSIPRTTKIFKTINKLMLRKFAHNKKYDIYHPTYYESFRINSGKLIITVYDMIHELFNEEFSNDRTLNDKKMMIHKADGIIAISESTKKDLINIFAVNPNKIKVVYLANSLHLLVGEKPVINCPYILYVGNRGGYKNFISMLEAFAMSKFREDLKIVCFGGGSFNIEEKNLIDKFSFSEKVIRQDGNDNVLANLYKYAELFIYPSKYEGFGLPPLEAMYYGTPVVASNTSSIPEILGNAGMYFDPNAVEDIRDKIDCTLNDSHIREKLVEDGYEREKLFSWERCAEDTLQFYNEVCGK